MCRVFCISLQEQVKCFSSCALNLWLPQRKHASNYNGHIRFFRYCYAETSIREQGSAGQLGRPPRPGMADPSGRAVPVHGLLLRPYKAQAGPARPVSTPRPPGVRSTSASPPPWWSPLGASCWPARHTPILLDSGDPRLGSPFDSERALDRPRHGRSLLLFRSKVSTPATLLLFDELDNRIVLLPYLMLHSIDFGTHCYCISYF